MEELKKITRGYLENNILPNNHFSICAIDGEILH